MTDQAETLERLKAALLQIGNLPLEFNTRARAIAQRAINRLGVPHEWRDALTDEQIYKAVDRGGVFTIPKEVAPMSAETKATVTNGGVINTTEEALFPVNPTTYNPPAIDMIPVESSNIESVGHDGIETMRVKFKSSGSYDYLGIKEDEFFELVNSPSVGKAYNALTKAHGIKGIKL